MGRLRRLFAAGGLALLLPVGPCDTPQQAVQLTHTEAHDGFPGATTLVDGDLLVTYREASDHGIWTFDGRLRSMRLHDGDWSSGTIYDPEVGSTSGGLPTVLRDGTVVVTFWVTDGSTWWEPYLIRSSDPTATQWEEPERIGSSFTGYAVVESPVVETASGELLVPLQGADRGDEHSSVRLSRFDGTRWTDRVVVQSGRDWQEPVLLERGDGSLLMAIRSDGDDDWIYTTTSIDGETWTPVQRVVQGTGRPSMVERDGRVLMMYRTGDGEGRYLCDGVSHHLSDGFFAYGAWVDGGAVVSVQADDQRHADLWFTRRPGPPCR